MMISFQRIAAVLPAFSITLLAAGCAFSQAANPETNKPTAAEAAGINESAAIALGAPKGTLIKAETNKPRGENQIVEVEGASGGRAVTSEQEWQNLFEAPVPPGDAFKIWIRHQNGPIMLKAKVNGKVQDNWIYHLVCPAKYRRVVFDSEVDAALKDVCLEIAERYEIRFLEIGTDGDYVHFLLQSVPSYHDATTTTTNQPQLTTTLNKNTTCG